MFRSLFSKCAFAIKTIVLFCFIYEFILVAVPSSLLSSRKVAFLLTTIYFFLKGNSLQSLWKKIGCREYKKIMIVALVSFVYVVILRMTVEGNGVNAASWYIYFTLYSVCGSFLFVELFDGKYEDLLKAIAIVTTFQACWCILTYYLDEFKILNATLFFIAEDENIGFESMTRLRSIGSAGSSLSVCLALSSFSFLYFVLKGKYVLLNTGLFLLCSFATMLAGTTGLIICIISLTSSMIISQRKGGKSFWFILLVPIVLLILSNNIGSLFDDYQYRHLTEKLFSFYESGLESDTFQALAQQEISGISTETIIGTGLSRGSTMSGAICLHDGGYFRNYFALGLVMVCIFYSVLYRNMFRLISHIDNKNFFFLLLIYLAVAVVVEYKEPYTFYYYVFFVFNSIVLAINNDIKQ